VLGALLLLIATLFRLISTSNPYGEHMLLLSNLFAQLQKKDVHLYLADDEIRYRSKDGAFSQQDKDIIDSRREEVIRFLRARAGVERTPLPSSGSVSPSVGQQQWWNLVTNVVTPPPPQLMHAVKRFDGIELAFVDASIRDILFRHDVLRTRFMVCSGKLITRLNPLEAFVIDIERLEKLNTSDGSDLIRQKVDEFTARGMSVADEWLVRAKIITSQDDKNRCSDNDGKSHHF